DFFCIDTVNSHACFSAQLCATLPLRTDSCSGVPGPEQGIRIVGATCRVYAVVQMRRRAAGIAAVADVADHAAGLDPLTGNQAGKTIQVRVVMPVPARPQ